MIAGSDPADRATAEGRPPQGGLSGGPRCGFAEGKRIGVMRFAAGFGTDAAFATALALLRQQGATLVEIKKIDNFDDDVVGAKRAQGPAGPN